MTGAPRWWQWPTVLSLDAPLVGVVWQWALARVAGVTVGWPHAVVLALSVWLAYAADRWFEGWRVHTSDIRTQRHRFYQQHRWSVAALWCGVLVIDVTIAFSRLTSQALMNGALLLVPVLGYVLSHQLIHRHRAWRLPKELCVAALMASGAAVFLWPAPRPGDLAIGVSLFGLVCFANVVLISLWEREVDRAQGQTSLAIDVDDATGAWAIRQLPWIVTALGLVLATGAAPELRRIALAGAVSGLLLAVTDRVERRHGWPLARVLADVCLLTPAVLLWRG
jgi:hypothetical protein